MSNTKGVKAKSSRGSGKLLHYCSLKENRSAWPRWTVHLTARLKANAMKKRLPRYITITLNATALNTCPLGTWTPFTCRSDSGKKTVSAEKSMSQKYASDSHHRDTHTGYCLLASFLFLERKIGEIFWHFESLGWFSYTHSLSLSQSAYFSHFSFSF